MNAPSTIADWFLAHLPEGWFTEPATVAVDRDEIYVSGRLAEGASPSDFREQSREQRVGIAREAEALFLRKVSWGVRVGAAEHRFAHLSVPVMTRLRIDERVILDTLIAGGIARSRSDALGWCVRLVARHEADWLSELRDAAARIAEVRAKGPE
jgi:hypothetical protein